MGVTLPLRLSLVILSSRAHRARLELVKAYNGKFSAALTNNSETPGISPTRMESTLPVAVRPKYQSGRDSRRLVKNSFDFISPRSCRSYAVSCRNRSLMSF